ncbi:MAG: hypothetical protein V4436_00585 [Patescibacteria group bacterium]
MRVNQSVRALVADLVIFDRQAGVPLHDNRFTMQEPNWLPKEPFTEEEIEAAHAVHSDIESAEDAEDN